MISTPSSLLRVGQPRALPLAIRQWLAFAIPPAVLLYYALRGGSYDIVVRQQEALVVWWIIGLSALVGIFPAWRFPRAGWIALTGLLLLGAWTALSLTWTESDERTLAEVARVAHYLGIVVLIWGVVGRDTWRAAAAGVATAGVAVTVYALCTRLLPGVFPADKVQTAFHLDRLNLPFNYWNAVAAWGAMSLAMALAWSAHAARLVLRALSLAAVPVCGLTVYLTYSRAGVAGAAVAVIAAVALGRNRWVTAVHAIGAALGTATAIAVTRGEPAIANGTSGSGAGKVIGALAVAGCVSALAVIGTSRADGDRKWRLRPRAARLALVLSVGALLLAAALAGPGLASRAWDGFKETKPASSSSDPSARLSSLGGARYRIWASSVDAFRAHPWQGIGAGSFEFWWSRHLQRYSFERDAHNLYLEQLGELGAPGLLLTLLVIGGLLMAAVAARWRTALDPAAAGAHAALVAAFLVFLVHAGVDWMWESTAVTVLALGAIAVAAVGQLRVPAVPRIWARAALTFVGLLLALVQVPGLVSTSLVRQSQAKFRHGDEAGAVTSARKAVESQPWASSPYVQRALVSESRGQTLAAVSDLHRAMQREPTNWRNPLLLARLEAARGRRSSAMRAFRRARELRPISRFFGRR